MKKRIQILCYFILGFGLLAKAQSNLPQIINASGNYVEINGYQLDYSVGEMVAVETLTLPEGFLTQGFLQPIEIGGGGGNFPTIIVWPAMSPNGDNQGHENLYIENIELYPDNEIQIFNRWGNLVYITKGYDNNQNVFSGKANTGLLIDHAEVPDGTYFYILKVNGPDFPKTLVQNGFFVLKRK